ncbi:MAG: hypothetical protein ABI690_13615 [Chloroflexota bacterium]
MIGLHVVVDNASPEALDRALLYLKRTKQRTVDIAAGAQIDRGMQFVERVRAEAPGITVFWRNLDPEDTGIHAKHSAEWVYQRKVAPFRAWMQRHRIVFMPDNETSGDDERIRTYANWEADFGRMLHTDGLYGAFCRFATGNIVESQYRLLKPVFDMMTPGDYVSPNEYSAQPGYPPGSGGHLERYKLMWKAAGRRLPTVIGEAGVAMNYNPGKGYIDAGMTDEAFAQQMIDEQVWYTDADGYEVDRHLFRVGAFSYGGYMLRSGVFTYLENYYAHKEPPIVIATPDTPTQTPPTAPPPSTDPVEVPRAEDPIWMHNLTKAKRARIAMGRLMLEFGDELRGFIVDDEAYELIGEMAGMLDARG